MIRFIFITEAREPKLVTTQRRRNNDRTSGLIARKGRKKERMRKVTRQIGTAFHNRTPKTVGNTTTDGETVFLHGNAIVKREGGKVFATLAGWNTPTTRERVNGITGAGFHQKNFVAMRNDEPVDEFAWYEV